MSAGEKLSDGGTVELLLFVFKRKLVHANPPSLGYGWMERRKERQEERNNVHRVIRDSVLYE